jgi:hypothetical protein
VSWIRHNLAGPHLLPISDNSLPSESCFASLGDGVDTMSFILKAETVKSDTFISLNLNLIYFKVHLTWGCKYIYGHTNEVLACE